MHEPSREDKTKKTDSKSQGDDTVGLQIPEYAFPQISEAMRKPKQNNFIDMVEMQKKQHIKLKTGKHGNNNKLIPA